MGAERLLFQNLRVKTAPSPASERTDRLTSCQPRLGRERLKPVSKSCSLSWCRKTSPRADGPNSAGRGVFTALGLAAASQTQRSRLLSVYTPPAPSPFTDLCLRHLRTADLADCHWHHCRGPRILHGSPRSLPGGVRAFGATSLVQRLYRRRVQRVRIWPPKKSPFRPSKPEIALSVPTDRHLLYSSPLLGRMVFRAPDSNSGRAHGRSD